MNSTFEQLAQRMLDRLPNKIKIKIGKTLPYMLVAGNIEKEFYYQDQLLETIIEVLTEMDEQLESEEYIKKLYQTNNDREKEI